MITNCSDQKQAFNQTNLTNRTAAVCIQSGCAAGPSNPTIPPSTRHAPPEADEDADAGGDADADGDAEAGGDADADTDADTANCERAHPHTL